MKQSKVMKQGTKMSKKFEPKTIFVLLLLFCFLLSQAQDNTRLLAEAIQEEAGEEAEETREEVKITTPPLPDQEIINDLVASVPRPADSWPGLEQISASAYLVMDADKDEIILAQNETQEAYPASMTKIMTALVVLEHPDYTPERPVYFSEIACAMPAPEASTAGFVPEEIAPTISCLYAMMTRSANEVANALAENYGGTIEGFVDLMNQKAKDLGCEHTNFVDPCGFGYVDHHTTAMDMYKITKQAMKHSLFQDLVKTKVYSLPATNFHSSSGWSNILNNNYLVAFSEAGMQSPWLKSIDGVKNGLTDIAGDCLTAAATTYDGRHLISIIFNAAYVGPNTNAFIGSSIMSRTLLEEAAIRLGSPRKEELGEAAQEKFDAWPTMASLKKVEEQVTESKPLPSFTLEPAETTLNLREYEEKLASEGKMTVNRNTALVLSILLAAFFVLSLIFVYLYAQKRRKEQIILRQKKRRYRS